MHFDSGPAETLMVIDQPPPEGVLMKTASSMKKINIRRTGDVRLTSAACACPYTVQV
jgi:hypothetical protein